jgi:hypothetical protein
VTIDDLFLPDHVERFSDLVDRTLSADRSPGVYVFAAAEPFDLPEGWSDILYIGSTGFRSLHERMNDYVREALLYPNPVYRRGAERKIAAFFAEHDDLRLAWVPEASKEDAEQYEEELLRLFVGEHGGRPPFNLRGGWVGGKPSSPRR